MLLRGLGSLPGDVSGWGGGGGVRGEDLNCQRCEKEHSVPQAKAINVGSVWCTQEQRMLCFDGAQGVLRKMAGEGT